MTTTIEYISRHDLDRQLVRLTRLTIAANTANIEDARDFATITLDNKPHFSDARAFVTIVIPDCDDSL